MEPQNQISNTKVVIDGKFYEHLAERISGAELKALADIPFSTELFMSVKGRLEDEIIHNEQYVEAANEVEYFYLKKKLEFTINKKPYEWYKQYILGAQIRKLGEIGDDEDIFLSIPLPYENEKVEDDSRVDLARPGMEHFFSTERPFRVVIIVNGREKTWDEKTISFQQVVLLAFGAADNNPNRVYTVTYCKGLEPKPEGTMVKGSIVGVKNKMIFNVTATDKS